MFPLSAGSTVQIKTFSSLAVSAQRVERKSQQISAPQLVIFYYLEPFGEHSAILKRLFELPGRIFWSRFASEQNLLAARRIANKKANKIWGEIISFVYEFERIRIGFYVRIYSFVTLTRGTASIRLHRGLLFGWECRPLPQESRPGI